MKVILSDKKVAVGKNTDKNIEVVIHNNPPKDNKNLEDIPEYVKERVTETRDIFSLFNGKKKISSIFKKNDKDEHDKPNRESVCKQVALCEKDIVAAILIDEYASYDDRINSLKSLYDKKLSNGKLANTISFIEEKKKKYITSDIIKDAISIYVDNAIRKSLSDYADIVKDILIAISYIANKEKYDKAVDDILKKYNESMMKSFMADLSEAYYRTDQAKRINMSLTNQNVKVQSFENDNDEYELRLASSINDKKSALFDTLVDCVSDSKETFAYLKKLMILFIYGKDIYEKVSIDKEKWEALDSVKDISCLPKEQYLFDKNKITSIIEKYNNKKYSNKEFFNAKSEIAKIMEDEINSKSHSALKYLGINNDDSDRNTKFSKEEYWIRHFNGVLWKNLVSYSAANIINTEKNEVKNNDKNNAKGKAKKGKKGNKTITKIKIKLTSEYKLKCNYWYKKLWKECYKFLSSKYMDVGKIVYHCAMPDEKLDRKFSGSVKFGEILEEYRNGITSFDYERIATTDDFDRKREMYVSFAINNFASSVVKDDKRKIDNEEDSMLYKFENSEYDAFIKANARRNIMRFFGGLSKWQESLHNFSSQVYNDINDYTIIDKKILNVFKNAIYRLRNESFHYITSEKNENDDDIKDNLFLKKLLEKECLDYTELIKSKWYSNNIFMWYKKEVVVDLMKHIYTNRKYCESGMPSYRRIVSNKQLISIINNEFKINIGNYIYERSKKNEYEKKYLSSMDFLFKQLYYYVFLNDDTIMDRFIRLLEKDNKNKQYLINEEGFEKFYERVKNICEYNQDIKFNEICHIIMSDYNQANNQIKMVEDNKESNKKMKQFPTLLHGYIRTIFIDFLKDKVNNINYKDIFANKIDIKTEEEYKDFGNEIPSLDVGTICFLDEKQIEDINGYTLAWYITGHFISATYLNHLIGAFNDYIVRICDISKREKYAGIKTDEKIIDKINAERKKVDSIVGVLSLVLEFSEQISNNVEDYFDSPEEYAKELLKYIQFEKDGNLYYKGLKKFCMQNYENADNGYIGIYFDGNNPIVNRNIVLANMYCNTEVLANSFVKNKKIDIGEIRKYFDLKNELDKVEYRNKNGIFYEKYLRKYIDFVNRKNRIELVNIRIYSEIMNELYSHLISWAYLRERDEMYYLLGYFYLYIKTLDENNVMKRIERENIFTIEDGAILRQIVALYTFYAEIIVKRNDVFKFDGRGKKYDKFSELYDNEYKEAYNLFEKNDSSIKNVRNYIDHFKYFAKYDKSILELYQDCYNELLRYNDKYRKNVVKMIKNHLYRKNIETEPEIDYSGKNGIKILLDNEKGKAQSEKFTYKVLKEKDNSKSNKTSKKQKNEGNMSVLFDGLELGFEEELEKGNKDMFARDKEFITDVLNLLNYKENS